MTKAAGLLPMAVVSVLMSAPGSLAQAGPPPSAPVPVSDRFVTPAGRSPTWPEVKCTRYREAWSSILAHRGPTAFAPAFLASQEDFIASGCTTQGRVCPRSPQEMDVANILTVLAMNAGTASTFLPFGCRD